MITDVTTATGTSRPGVSWKKLLLPPEHGGWGFLFEPILLGLLLAPSWAGAAVALAAVATFFVRQPLKLALFDRLRGKRYPRTALAERLAVVLAVVAALSLAAALQASAAPLWPLLLLGAPLAAVQVTYDAQARTREVVPEVAGAAALGLAAPAMALAAGWSTVPALGLWLLVLARAVPSLLYARAMVQRLHGEAAPAWPALALHLAALAAVALAAWQGVVPVAVLAVPLLLLARAAYGLIRSAVAPMPARRLGWGEIAFGLAAVVLAATGYAVGR